MIRPIRCGAGVAISCLALLSATSRAQDTLPPLDQGVRIGITYTPGVRPGMLVLGGPSLPILDSTRALLRRDLDFSDRFEMINLPGGDSLTIGLLLTGGASGSGSGSESTEVFVNYALYAALGADYAVHAGLESDSTVTLSLYDVRGESARSERTLLFAGREWQEFRMEVHRAADAVVQAIAGTPGISATRLLFVRRGKIYRVDSDGWGVEMVSPPDMSALSPAWDPEGNSLAYMDFDRGSIVLQGLEADTPTVLLEAGGFQNFTPAFSPDGETLAFSRTTSSGTDIYAYNIALDCCLQRLTVGRFSDNLSPTYSPDGQQIAFVSTRVGQPQIYLMASDGTAQELFAPFDFGMTGHSNAPEWSPDGLNVAFHRDVNGSPQVFVMDVASRTVRQLTSAGRNEDPTWAPDGQHLAFVSNRTGSRQIWIIDLETGRIRQLTRLGGTRLPTWSRQITEVNNPRDVE